MFEGTEVLLDLLKAGCFEIFMLCCDSGRRLFPVPLTRTSESVALDLTSRVA